MKHRKALFASIWMIALGVSLWISGQVVGSKFGIIYHEGSWWNPAWYELTWAFHLGVGLALSGIVVIILSIFGIVTASVKEVLDRKKET